MGNWTAKWSDVMLPAESQSTGSKILGCCVGRDSVSQVMTRTRVWPLLCVGPLTCCHRLCDSSTLQKWVAFVSPTSSRWKFRSPTISRHRAGDKLLRNKSHSWRNSLALWPLAAEGGGLRYTEHADGFSSHTQQTVHKLELGMGTFRCWVLQFNLEVGPEHESNASPSPASWPWNVHYIVSRWYQFI